MSKRDYKTDVSDGMELEPLEGNGTADKEITKTNGTPFVEGKCLRRQSPSLPQPDDGDVDKCDCRFCNSNLM